MGKKKKGRKDPGRTPMPEQEPEARVKNFLEVPRGYTPELAEREARLAAEEERLRRERQLQAEREKLAAERAAAAEIE